MSTKTSYREALCDAHREAMAADSRVFLMGEDVGRYGGTYAVSKGLLEEFGPERVRDTPLSDPLWVLRPRSRLVFGGLGNWFRV